MPSPHQFTYFQGGGFDASLLSFLEIDRDGSVNVSKLAFRPHVTAGAGGFVDITARAKKIVFSGMFNAGAKLLDRRRQARDREGRQAQEAGRRGRARHLLRPARRRAGAGHHLCHRALRDEADARRPRASPRSRRASILQRDILAQSEFPLLVADNLKIMDAATLRPAARSVSPCPPSRRGAHVACLIHASRSTWEGPIALITISRPEKLNALDLDMLAVARGRLRRDRGQSRSTCRRDHRRGQGLLHRRRHQGLGDHAAARVRLRLGALRPSRLRPAGRHCACR